MGGDHARGLSARGKEEAATLARWLAAQGIYPDLVLCSTAVRTRETLAALGSQWPTILSDKLYLASSDEILRQIQQVEDGVRTLVVVGHNPGIQMLLGELAGDAQSEELWHQQFPTGGAVVAEVKTDQWRDLRKYRETQECTPVQKSIFCIVQSNLTW